MELREIYALEHDDQSNLMPSKPWLAAVELWLDPGETKL